MGDMRQTDARKIRHTDKKLSFGWVDAEKAFVVYEKSKQRSLRPYEVEDE